MSLFVDTDDEASFSSQQVSLEVAIQQSIVNKTRSLIIKLEFNAITTSEIAPTGSKELEQFGYEKTKFSIPSITCSEKDKKWYFLLPQVIDKEESEVKI